MQHCTKALNSHRAKKKPLHKQGLNGCRTRNGTCSQVLRVRFAQKVHASVKYFSRLAETKQINAVIPASIRSACSSIPNQCASSQLLPEPASASNGTSSLAACCIKSTKAAWCRARPCSLISNTSSSCTCMIIRISVGSCCCRY